MKTIRISKQSVQTATRILVERGKSMSPPAKRGTTVRLSAAEINTAYKKVLRDGKKI